MLATKVSTFNETTGLRVSPLPWNRLFSIP